MMSHDSSLRNMSVSLREYLVAANSLEVVILHGLLELKSPSNAWSVFLTRGLYDPRLFLFIWPFANEYHNSEESRKRKADSDLESDSEYDSDEEDDDSLDAEF